MRFVLELCGLAALASWGAQTGEGTVSEVGLAVATPIVAAAAWGLLVSPKRRVDVPVLRWAVELSFFAAAALGLAAVDHAGLAVALVVVYAVNRALMLLWRQ